MTSLNLDLTPVLTAIYLFFSSAIFLTASEARQHPARLVSSVAASSAARPSAGQPFLWRVEGPRPSWLFGTIHSADPMVARLPPSVTTALDRSRSFHPEVALSADLAAKLAAKLFTADTPNLSTRLSSTLWARVKRAGAELGLPELMIERLTPGLAMLFFSAPTDTDVDATVDGQLYTRASARSISIKPLETIDEQLAIFGQLPEDQAIAALAEVLNEAEHGRPNEKRLLRAYASGDERALIAVIEAEFASSPGARALAEPLLYRRNRQMADRLAPHLSTGGAFVAIGAAHLTGPKSVIALLRARGFKITRAP